MIVFSHVPKTAGTSLCRSLYEVYQDGFLCHYGNKKHHKIGKKMLECSHAITRDNCEEYLQHIKMIFGHFDLAHFDFVRRDKRRAIVFREPVSRVCSHFYTYLRVENSAEVAQADGVDISSLGKFALTANPGIYRRYLAGHDMKDLDFVGITERYEESIALLGKVFGVKVKIYQENVNHSARTYRDVLREEGDDIVERVEAKEAGNRAIYDRAMLRFDELLLRHGI